MHVGVPYAALLAGTPAATVVNTVDVPLANYFRAKGLPLVITLDVTDGLNRAAEAPQLVALGRSITEPEVQLAYRRYAQAIVSIIRPQYLGLAAETNLIRFAAPPAVYSALAAMTNLAAAQVRALGGVQPALFVSVQAELAWGKATNTPFAGVETDFRDFPFVESLGISAYPYLAWADPDSVPLDYYARLAGDHTVRLLVVEGGWASGSVGSIRSSPEVQARWLRRQERLLDSARAVAALQLNFTDLDLAAFPPQTSGAALSPFAQLGLVDANLRPKRALATYDSIFARPLIP
jgi:hypothetical protein